MLRKLYCIGLLSLLSSSLGCALCCSPDDCNYGAYGGRWERQDRSSGRVGSAFAEAGYDTMAGATDAGTGAEAVSGPGDNHLRPASYEQVSSFIDIVGE